MFIAHVHLTVSERDLETVLETLLKECGVVKAMQGNIKFIPFADPTRVGGIGILHEWNSETDFAKYISSTSFKDFGSTIKPLVVTPPISDRFEAKLLETVN